ncbi:ChaN family lipoprotein [Imtechella halotolerans]|uniref:Haem-binding uptake Tiki superfamily ChaN domain-containing protein n=1 Tax=Imtechella halotolerans K1 TaxID=946077 RepID=I0WJS8_9FLAO|nr:ChaN family lipoprotein [Imtechella halotolerans]EID76644.1 hypothetical protein W5A_01435 [Imtechella halotolerans K1]WMQ62787.1 ChaN family lipoprotein [Imtechella halotolerans]
MKKLFLAGITLLWSSTFLGQNKAPYQFYNSKGKKTSYSKLLKNTKKVDIVLFGEFHDNSIVHWLQLEFTKDIAQKRALILGAEMIETDNQQALNQYLKGEITQKGLDTLARLWNNHKTDYKPLVDFAKNNRTPFIATNVPRRYASMVFREGFEALNSLPSNEKKWIAPLPIPYDSTLPGYVKMIEMMGGHGGENLPKAQALKDATMAHNILENHIQGSLFIHYNGSYHSDDYEGIYWYLKKWQPSLKLITIATVTQSSINSLDKQYLNKADFILVIDEDVTRTY